MLNRTSERFRLIDFDFDFRFVNYLKASRLKACNEKNSYLNDISGKFEKNAEII